MSVQDILTVAGTATPLAIGLMTFLVKFIKNERAKRALSTALRLAEALQPLIVEAEQFTHYTGEEKKQYVLTRANRFAIEHRLRFDEGEAARLVEELVATTKKVNARGGGAGKAEGLGHVKTEAAGPVL